MADESIKIAILGAGCVIKKLSDPSLDYLGQLFRDKIRTWRSSALKEKALLRQFENESLYRQIDLRIAGVEKCASALDSALTLLLDQYLETIIPLMRHAVALSKMPPNRAIQCVVDARSQELGELPADSGEKILCCVVAGARNMVVAIHTAKLLLFLSETPAGLHLGNPQLTDDELDSLMQNPKILEPLAASVHTSSDALDAMLEKGLKAAYEPYLEKPPAPGQVPPAGIEPSRS